MLRLAWDTRCGLECKARDSQRHTRSRGGRATWACVRLSAAGLACGSASCASRRCRRVCAPAEAGNPRCVACRRRRSEVRRNPRGPGERHLWGNTWRSGKIRQGASAMITSRMQEPAFGNSVPYPTPAACGRPVRSPATRTITVKVINHYGGEVLKVYEV